jgi:transcription antitermination protein NusB
MRSRRRARELALRILYAVELSQNPLHEIIDKLLIKRSKNQQLYDFCTTLIFKTSDHAVEFDEMIRKKALNWDFNRIAIIDRIILRLAMCEFLHFEDIPPKVTIDEAIEISKKYSTEKSGKFINGILDSVLNEWQENNRMKKVGRGLIDIGRKTEDDRL